MTTIEKKQALLEQALVYRYFAIEIDRLKRWPSTPQLPQSAIDRIIAQHEERLEIAALRIETLLEISSPTDDFPDLFVHLLTLLSVN